MIRSIHGRAGLLVSLLVLACLASQAQAQHADHSAHMTAPTVATEPSDKEPDVVKHDGMTHAEMDHAQMDHAQMGHAPVKSAQPERGDATILSNESIPEPTAADRAAAFPVLAGHAMHDNAVHSYWLLDRLEAFKDDQQTGLGWEINSWVGTDLDRLWLRSEGEIVGGDTEAADLEALYGRSISPWWDVVAGVRQEWGDDSSQTFAAIGLQGLAPYKFEVQATAYVGEGGQTAARLEVEYDTLLSNRWILQWLAEAEWYGQEDRTRGISSGLNSVEAGLRLRYEINRQFAPYVGVSWERALGLAADLRQEDGADRSDAHLVAGLRVWF